MRKRGEVSRWQGVEGANAYGSQSTTRAWSINRTCALHGFARWESLTSTRMRLVDPWWPPKWLIWSCIGIVLYLIVAILLLQGVLPWPATWFKLDERRALIPLMLWAVIVGPCERLARDRKKAAARGADCRLCPACEYPGDLTNSRPCTECGRTFDNVALSRFRVWAWKK